MPPLEERQPTILGKIGDEALHIVDDIVGVPLYADTKLANGAIETGFTDDYHFEYRWGRNRFLVTDARRENPLLFEPVDPHLVWPEDNSAITVPEAVALRMKKQLAEVNFDQRLSILQETIRKKPRSEQARVASENAALIVRAQHVANVLKSWRAHPSSLSQEVTTLFNEAVTWQRDKLATEQGKLLHNVIRSMSNFSIESFLKHTGSTIATDVVLAALSISTPSTWPLTLAKMFVKPIHGYVVTKNAHYDVYGESPTNKNVVGWFRASEDSTKYVEAYRRFAQVYNSLPPQYKIVDPLDHRRKLDFLPIDDRSMELVAIALFTSVPDRAFCRINSLASQMECANADLIRRLYELDHPKKR